MILCYWMSRISNLLNQSFCYCHLSLVWGLPPFYRSPASIWVAGVLILFMPWPLSSCILLWSGSTYHMHCMFYHMPETASACVLHHIIDIFLLCTPFSVLWVTVYHLSWFAYSFVYGQSLWCLVYNTFFWALCSSTPLAHLSTWSLSLSCVFFWAVSYFMISCMISSPS